VTPLHDGLKKAGYQIDQADTYEKTQIKNTIRVNRKIKTHGLRSED